MSGRIIPRMQVHRLSDDVGDNLAAHQGRLVALMREQRALSIFFEGNASALGSARATATFFVAVVARIFEGAGGRMRPATRDRVLAAADRVADASAALLPYDDGFRDRLRAVPWRAQPHILDGAILGLFDTPIHPLEPERSLDVSLQILFLVWVATEALDASWRPPVGFQGESDYHYLHVEPRSAAAPGGA